VHTLEQERIQTTLLNQGVNIILNKTLVHAREGLVDARCVYTQRVSQIPCKTLVLVTERLPETTLYEQLIASTKSGSPNKHHHIELIGDALAPGLIVDAIYSGHLAAENFETPEIEIERAMYMREMPNLK
jgi:dimethylamine/trimethylamine dehydrogenase